MLSTKADTAGLSIKPSLLALSCQDPLYYKIPLVHIRQNYMILVARIRIISFIKEENRGKVPFIKEENGVFETNSLGKCDF